MTCEYCDNEVPDGVKCCPSCGAVLKRSAASVVQPTQVTNAPEQAMPVHGQSMPSPVQQSLPTERKSRVTYILLGLFLGGLGIHNFYAERTNRALGQLLTTLLAGWLIFPLIAVFIWVVCDICAITTDGNGVKFA